MSPCTRDTARRARVHQEAMSCIGTSTQYCDAQRQALITISHRFACLCNQRVSAWCRPKKRRREQLKLAGAPPNQQALCMIQTFCKGFWHTGQYCPARPPLPALLLCTLHKQSGRLSYRWQMLLNVCRQSRSIVSPLYWGCWVDDPAKCYLHALV